MKPAPWTFAAGTLQDWLGRRFAIAAI